MNSVGCLRTNIQLRFCSPFAYANASQALVGVFFLSMSSGSDDE
jgi:hypothetical protein